MGVAISDPSTESGSASAPLVGNAPGRKLRRLMFASQKGGVGKTASAVNVAACLGMSGFKVLLVDTDPIGSLAACFGVTVAPGHPGLFGMGQWELEDLIIPEIATNL